MEKMNYCVDCKRIFSSAAECSYCSSKSVKELAENAPVNIIGSKLKGRFLKACPGSVKVLLVDESKNRTIKEFDASKLRKIL